MKQFFSFVKKEFRHIIRDRRTLLILVVMPIVMIILFGYAVTTDVRGTRVAVLDFSKDQATRQLCEQLDANAYFSVVADVPSRAALDTLFRRGAIDMAVVFDAGFADRMMSVEGVTVGLLADGSEPNQASLRTGYAENVLRSGYAALAGQNRASLPMLSVVRMPYNPQSQSAFNFVPGVIGMIMLLICAMMTSISIVRERELGTMEVLLASPLPPLLMVVSKLVPYFLVSCVNLLTILLLSTQLLGVPIRGSLWGFVALTLLYVVVSLLLGLLVSTLVETQLAAMLLSLLLIVPTMYLSGFAFPLESIPWILQQLSAIVPARWFIEAARKLMIQGVPLECIAREAGVLALMSVVLLLVCWRKFRVRL